MNNKFLLKTTLLAVLGLATAFVSHGQKTTTKPPAKTGNNKPSTSASKPSTPPKTATTVNANAPKIDVKNVGRAPGNYAIKVKIKGFKNVNLYLADNFADKQYFRDTCKLDANGVGTFTGAPKLQRGIYMIVFPEMDWWFELPITDDQIFYFEADTSRDETKIRIEGSIENQSFADYQAQRAIHGRKRYELDQQIKLALEASSHIFFLPAVSSYHQTTPVQ